MPVGLRAAVSYVELEYAISERHACRLLGLARSTHRYRARRSERDLALRTRLKELATKRMRFGYRRLTAMLVREGMVANHKRVYRLYREEGLAMRIRQRRRGRRRPSRPAIPRVANGPSPPGGGHCWPPFFMHPACYLGPKRRGVCRPGTGACRNPSVSASPACVRAGSAGTSKWVSGEVLCFGFAA